MTRRPAASSVPTPWSRRQWLGRHGIGLAALMVQRPFGPRSLGRQEEISHTLAIRAARSVEHHDPAHWQALAQRAVEAAQAAGARYAEAHLTRVVAHSYAIAGAGTVLRGSGVMLPRLADVHETMGVGVRALVGGGWGFSASPVLTADEVVLLARDAVGQATANASVPGTVELGQIPIARGTWTTPIRIDPFQISIEEKIDTIASWKLAAEAAGLAGVISYLGQTLTFVRQERVVATSEGALFTQTLYESGGETVVTNGGASSTSANFGTIPVSMAVHGLTPSASGWEHVLDAQIPEQFASGRIRAALDAQAAVGHKPSAVGRYTVVYDGATMAALVESTLGAATQLDRALGYEANAGGTSWLDDPLAMLGHAQVTSPLVTLTANRSAPGQLATVGWDEEGVAPRDFTLINEGRLIDFQTTREQAAWLAPYYQAHGRPVRSNGCSAAEDAHVVPIQHMPNLTLSAAGTAQAAAVQVADLVRDVTEGLLVEGGAVQQVDSQLRTGLVVGPMREIRNGRLGKAIDHGTILLDVPKLWTSIASVGGHATEGGIDFSVGIMKASWIREVWLATFGGGPGLQLDRGMKGEPAQQSSHSVRAVAALVPNQALVNADRKVG